MLLLLSLVLFWFFPLPQCWGWGGDDAPARPKVGVSLAWWWHVAPIRSPPPSSTATPKSPVLAGLEGAEVLPPRWGLGERKPTKKLQKTNKETKQEAVKFSRRRRSSFPGMCVWGAGGAKPVPGFFFIFSTAESAYGADWRSQKGASNYHAWSRLNWPPLHCTDCTAPGCSASCSSNRSLSPLRLFIRHFIAPLFWGGN